MGTSSQGRPGREPGRRELGRAMSQRMETRLVASSLPSSGDVEELLLGMLQCGCE